MLNLNENMVQKNNLDKCIIITTINNPSQQLISYTNTEGWDLIVVGDAKTNNLLYKNINCIYLGLDEQKLQFPSFFNLVPVNSYTRKMFGYLYAIKNNYKVIYDTDDDNEYTEIIDSYKNNFKIIDNVEFTDDNVESFNIDSITNYIKINDYMSKNNTNCFTFNKKDNTLYFKNSNSFIPEKSINNNCVSGIFRNIKMCCDKGFVNIYKLFTNEHIWPRGIPPSHESIDIIPTVNDIQTNLQISVIQGLVNNDPDVDAFYRINIKNTPFTFEKDNDYDIVMDKYSVCPFNTQNTFWFDKSMFYAMYLPISVTFRYTDILRGFIALYQLWKNNKTIKFTFPTAVQERNEHDLSKDYESEIPMYDTAEKVIELLNKNKDATMLEIYDILYKHNIVDKKELETLNEWVNLINSY